MTSHVDHAEIKLGQILTIAVASTALFYQDVRPLVVLGIIFLISGTIRPMSPFGLLYRWLVLPMGIMISDYRLDNIQPHKFGQLVGALTVAIALVLIQSGYSIVGWVVIVVLIGLTLLSYTGWCIGCFMYYQLNKLGLGGFFRHTPTDKNVPLGSRPGKKE